jgi:hypothetical protein
VISCFSTHRLSNMFSIPFWDMRNIVASGGN